MVSSKIYARTSYSKRTALGKLDEVQLLALLGSGDMRRDEWIHEGLKVGSPPLGKGVGNLPLALVASVCELGAGWSKALVQTVLEARDLFSIMW